MIPSIYFFHIFCFLCFYELKTISFIEVGCRQLALASQKLFDGSVLKGKEFLWVKYMIDAIRGLMNVIEVQVEPNLLPTLLGKSFSPITQCTNRDVVDVEKEVYSSAFDRCHNLVLQDVEKYAGKAYQPPKTHSIDLLKVQLSFIILFFSFMLSF
jgi:hypothetical protein